MPRLGIELIVSTKTIDRWQQDLAERLRGVSLACLFAVPAAALICNYGISEDHTLTPGIFLWLVYVVSAGIAIKPKPFENAFGQLCLFSLLPGALLSATMLLITVLPVFYGLNHLAPNDPTLRAFHFSLPLIFVVSPLFIICAHLRRDFFIGMARIKINEILKIKTRIWIWVGLVASIIGAALALRAYFH